MNTKVKILGLIVLMIGCLYFFICSLAIFKTSFQLLCSNLTTSFLVYANLSNPILGLMLGVVVTAFVQGKCQIILIMILIVRIDSQGHPKGEVSVK